MPRHFSLIPVDSAHDPRIADYLNVRDHELLQRTDPTDPAGHRGLFMAESDLVVRALFDSPYRAKSVLITPTRLDAMRDLFSPLDPSYSMTETSPKRERGRASPSSSHALPCLRGGLVGDATPASNAVPVYLVPQDVMNSVVGFNIHRGVLAVGLRPAPSTFDALLDEAEVVVVLEDLTNHDNLGGICRNLAGLIGAKASRLLLSPRCADPLYRKSLRVSMGHALSIPMLRSADWPGDLGRLRDRGFTVLALTPAPLADDLGDLLFSGNPLPSRVALLLGSEGPGLSPAALALADRLVRIPMRPGVDSLNVATAGAIALFTLSSARRRNPAGASGV